MRLENARPPGGGRIPAHGENAGEGKPPSRGGQHRHAVATDALAVQALGDSPASRLTGPRGRLSGPEDQGLEEIQEKSGEELGNDDPPVTELRDGGNPEQKQGADGELNRPGFIGAPET